MLDWLRNQFLLTLTLMGEKLQIRQIRLNTEWGDIQQIGRLWVKRKKTYNHIGVLLAEQFPFLTETLSQSVLYWFWQVDFIKLGNTFDLVNSFKLQIIDLGHSFNNHIRRNGLKFHLQLGQQINKLDK